MEEQSVRGFYYHASYGKMDLTGTVLPLYEAPEAAADYEAKKFDIKTMYHEAIQSYIDSGLLNLEDYDSDGDGYVDGLTVVPVGPFNYDFWWDFVSVLPDRTFEGTDIRIVQISQVTLEGMRSGVTSLDYELSHPIVHETGHLLGLPDNYGNPDIRNVLSGALCEVMAGVEGCWQINVYYKWLLNWIEPEILTNQDVISGDASNVMELYATESFPNDLSPEPKAVVLFTEPHIKPFGVFFIIEYIRGYKKNYSKILTP